MLFTVFNKIAHYIHLLEEWLVSIVHVSDCVATLETTNLLSSKTLRYIDFLYGHNAVSYKLRIPVHLSKKMGNPIMSATINELVDITDKVHGMAGPFHNFFMQPLKVKDIIPEKYHDNFRNLEIMTSDLQMHKYYNLNDRIHFHYGLDWAKYDKSAAYRTLGRLEYLDLAY